MSQINNKFSRFKTNRLIRFLLTHRYEIIQLLIFIVYIVLCVGLVFSNGVCCGDDAYHATVAKNLSNGLGYTSTVLDSNTNFRETLFDARIGVGPVLILPAALIIKIFGNTHWAPGMTIILIWGVLLLTLRFTLAKFVTNPKYLTVGVIIFITFSYIFFAYHFEQWYALFGEIPAALLIILAILIYYQADTPKNAYFAGFLFSLATQAKPIAILPFVSFLAFIIIYNFYFSPSHVDDYEKTNFSQILLITLGFLTPILLFELWKCLRLGFSDYFDHLNNHFNWAREKGISGTSFSWSQINERIKLINQRFGIYLPVILLVLSGNLFIIRRDNKLTQIYFSFYTIVICYLPYWFLFSIGWARYFIICLVIILFMLILPLFVKQEDNKLKIIYGIVLIVLSIYNVIVIDISFPFADKKLFSPSEYTESIGTMSEILSNQLEKRPFITQWWATAADLEYSMSTHLNFTTFRDSEISFNKPFIMVANSKFILQEDQDFIELLSECEMRQVGQFVYGVCDP